MATIQSTLALQDKMSPAFSAINKAINSTLTAIRSIKGAELGPEFAAAAADVKLAENAISDMNSQLQETPPATQMATDGYTMMKGIAVNALTAIGRAAKNAVGDIVEMTDFLTNSTARLNLINDGMQTTAELQEMIYQSAQRSRGAYQTTLNTVASLGAQARDAFSSNAEIIAFSELLNKTFVTAGTSAQGMESVMYNLTQALGSGVLRGQDLNAVMSNTPQILQYVADYMEIPMGQIRTMAAEGELSADVIRAAMFAAADEINANFATMPMTIGQIGTHVSNALLVAFQPLLQGIGEAARWIYDNWETVAPVFVGVATAVAALAVGWGIYTVATWLAVAANRALIASFLTNPITLIAVAIGVIIGLIYKWVQSVGGLEIAWAIVVDALMYGWDIVKIGFFTGVYWVQNLMDKMGLGIQKVGAAIAGFMGDMKVNVLTILENMVNGAINIINDFISTVNKVLPTNIELIEHVTFAATAAAENEAAKQARAADIAQAETDIAAKAAERDASLAQMRQDAADSHALRQAEILEKQATAFAEQTADGGYNPADDPMNKVIEGSGGGASVRTSGEVKIDGEELRMLLDISTMRFQATYNQLTPQINLNVDTIRESADINQVIEYVADWVEEANGSSLVIG